MTARTAADVFQAEIQTPPAVAGQSYSPSEAVTVTIPSTGGPFVDAKGDTASLGDTVFVQRTNFGIIQAAAEMTVAEFLNVNMIDAPNTKTNLKDRIEVVLSANHNINGTTTRVQFNTVIDQRGTGLTLNPNGGINVKAGKTYRVAASLFIDNMSPAENWMQWSLVNQNGNSFYPKNVETTKQAGVASGSSMETEITPIADAQIFIGRKSGATAKVRADLLTQLIVEEL